MKKTWFVILQPALKFKVGEILEQPHVHQKGLDHDSQIDCQS